MIHLRCRSLRYIRRNAQNQRPNTFIDGAGFGVFGHIEHPKKISKYLFS